MSFAAEVSKGFSAGGWVIGMLASLGLFVGMVCLIGFVLTYLLSGNPEDEVDDDRTRRDGRRKEGKHERKDQ